MSSGALQASTMIERAQTFAQRAAVAGLIAALAWSPFPLGGAIAWAAGIQEILVALCWSLWLIGTAGTAEGIQANNKVIAIPLCLGIWALCWAVAQISPWVPASWAHPVWTMASDTLATPLRGVVSLNPWRTQAEILKLASYIVAGWLAFSMARRAETAKLLLHAIIVIGAVYAVYAFALDLWGLQQVNVFYSVPYKSSVISGPFMLHNSFATYCGMAALAAFGALFAAGSSAVVGDRGGKRLAETALSFAFGRGAPYLAAAILLFAAVVASASRAGFAATVSGLMAMTLVGLALMRSRGVRFSVIACGLGGAAVLVGLITLNGDALDQRIGTLLGSDTGDGIRLALWSAAQRMIADAPWFGLGLGTFEDAYPLYASQVFPFVMDKAHCDYLEFAAGLGLPAAIMWWCAFLWLVALCARGVRIRQRNRSYAIVAIGSSVLVAVHSSVDFSLQMPAVALLYAVLLGIGVAQSQSSRSWAKFRQGIQRKGATLDASKLHSVLLPVGTKHVTDIRL